MRRSSHTLSELAGRPFELLKALEVRTRTAAAGGSLGSGAGDEWVGLGFRVGDLKLVAAREHVRELMYYPGVRAVPGAKAWLLGVANVRGQLLPVTDLKQFLGGGETVVSRSSRVLAVNHPHMVAGLLVDEVYGFRRFGSHDEAVFDSALLPAIKQWVTGGFRRDDEGWGVLALQSLIEAPAFLQAAQKHAEAGT